MDGLLDEWMIGFEFKENLKWISCIQKLCEAFRIFLQDCFILMLLIRNHPAIHSSNHPWDGSEKH
jgi:hypothetical protein